MVSSAQTVDQSDSGVDDSLQRRYGGVGQPGEQSVAVVKPRENNLNKCGDKTKQPSNLTQSSEMEKTRLCLQSSTNFCIRVCTHLADYAVVRPQLSSTIIHTFVIVFIFDMHFWFCRTSCFYPMIMQLHVSVWCGSTTWQKFNTRNAPLRRRGTKLPNVDLSCLTPNY